MDCAWVDDEKVRGRLARLVASVLLGENRVTLARYLNCVASGKKADDSEEGDDNEKGINLPPWWGEPGQPKRITCDDMPPQDLEPGDAFWFAGVEGTRESYTLSGIFMNATECYEFEPLLTVDAGGILLQI